MKLDLIFDLFRLLDDDKHCFLYRGKFISEFLNIIYELIEANINWQNESLKTRKRISYLSTEIIQNIFRHGARVVTKSVDSNDAKFFMARNFYDRHYLVSGNLVQKDNVSNITQRIHELNSLDNKKLHQKYNEVLEHGELSNKGGAGLGLIDMAKKSDYKLCYSFKAINDNLSVFYKQLILNSDNTIKQKHIAGICDAITFHEKLVNNDILLVQKGDFAKDSVQPILHIIEQFIARSKKVSHVVLKMFRVMHAILKNMSNNCFSPQDEKEGIFIISQKEGKYQLGSGYFIHNNETTNLSRNIDKLNKMTKNELNNWYFKKSLSNIEGGKTNAEVSLDLIRIANEISSKLNYDFEKIDSEKSFFSMYVEV